MTDPNERDQMGFKSMNELLDQPTYIINGRSVKAPSFAAAVFAVEEREQHDELYTEVHESAAELAAADYNDEEG